MREKTYSKTRYIMAKFIVIFFILSIGITVIGNMVAEAKSQYPQVKVYDYEDLTLEHLENRKDSGEIIIERIVGTVINENLDGNTQDGCYMSYKGVEGAKVGNRIVTYCVYNPETNYCDDVVLRMDFIIK